MGERTVVRLALVTLLVLAAVLAVGCGSEAGSDSQKSPTPTAGEPPVAGRSDAGAGPGSSPSGSSDASRARRVLMLGRSVMYGWFKHWGWDGTPEGLPVEREGWALDYGEMQTPPDIANSAIELMRQAPEGSVVFFKFCFDDFPGGEEAASRLEEQKAWVRQVADAAGERDQRVVVGNALPKVASATDATLVAEHRAFNEWLDDFSRQSGGRVRVYDFYSVLADDSGALKSAYATSPDDSHPNDAGYAALDVGFFALLDEAAR